MTDTMSNISKTLLLSIEGMACSGCSQSVERALKAVEGVHEVGVDLAAKQVTVRFDARIASQEAFLSALVESGYQALVI
ncbi:heavy-metal-associated domain-containing protein [Candidatus Bipolaricaulota bacterium]